MKKIHETTNYDLFKLNPANAEIKSEHVDRLKASIKLKNMLHLRPILVNAGMEIIDGQHRFTAAKALNLPVFYEVDQGLTEDDMALLNSNSRTWGLSDFVHHFKNRGKVDYQKLEDFCKKNSLKLTTATYLLGQQSGKISSSIKSGTYKFASKDAADKAEQKLLMFETVANLIRHQSLMVPSFIKGSGFFKGNIAIFSHENFRLDIYLKKIELHIDKIQKRADPTGYYHMLKDIYNWKNQNPLD